MKSAIYFFGAIGILEACFLALPTAEFGPSIPIILTLTMTGFIVYVISCFNDRQKESKEEYKTFGLAGFRASLMILFAFLGFLIFYPQSSISFEMVMNHLLKDPISSEYGPIMKYLSESNAYAAGHLLAFSLMALFGLLLLFFQTKKGRSFFSCLVLTSVIACMVTAIYMSMETRAQVLKRIAYEKEMQSPARIIFDKRCKEDAGYKIHASIPVPQDGIIISGERRFKDERLVLHTLIGSSGAHENAYPVKTKFRLLFAEIYKYRYYLPENENILGIPGNKRRYSSSLLQDIDIDTIRSRYLLQLEDDTIPEDRGVGLHKNHWSLIDQHTGEKVAERIRYEYISVVPGWICSKQLRSSTMQCVQGEVFSWQCPEGGEAEDVDWLLGILQAKKN
jgi:hypothetical protein